jgi:hypothetical protein
MNFSLRIKLTVAEFSHANLVYLPLVFFFTFIVGILSENFSVRVWLYPMSKAEAAGVLTA